MFFFYFAKKNPPKSSSVKLLLYSFIFVIYFTKNLVVSEVTLVVVVGAYVISGSVAKLPVYSRFSVSTAMASCSEVCIFFISTPYFI